MVTVEDGVFGVLADAAAVIEGLSRLGDRPEATKG